MSAPKNKILSLSSSAMAICLLSLILLGFTGCSSLNMTALKSDNGEWTFARSSAKKSDEAKSPLMKLISFDQFHNKSEETTQPAVQLAGSLEPIDGQAAFDDAMRYYDNQDYKKAEQELKSIAKKHQNSRIREDAIFYTGESLYKQQRYPYAQDQYDLLLKEFPHTRYMEKVARRMFAIASHWLQAPKLATSDDIKPVNFEKPMSTPKPDEKAVKSKDPTRRVPILPQFWDRTRPMFDTNGRALQALQSIWMNDPSGKLADDAVMMAASFYLRQGRDQEAERYYRILREQFPDSPYLEQAFVLGSHVTLTSYQGAAYDGKKLDEARKLKESTLRLFPGAKETTRLRSELQKIEEAKAASIWKDIEYYQAKNLDKATAIYCQVLLEEHPHSSYAARARELLRKVAPNAAIPTPALQPPPSYSEFIGPEQGGMTLAEALKEEGSSPSVSATLQHEFPQQTVLDEIEEEEHQESQQARLGRLTRIFLRQQREKARIESGEAPETQNKPAPVKKKWWERKSSTNPYSSD